MADPQAPDSQPQARVISDGENEAAALATAAAAVAEGLVPSAAEPPNKAPRTSDSSAASLRHIQTEKRRRDRINEGYTLLRELVPSKDKADKAAILMQVVEYIRQVQAVMTQVLAHAPHGQLPEELQWSVRMLLPREGSGPGFTPAAAAAAGAGFGQHAQAMGFAPQQLMMQQGAAQGVGEGYAPTSNVDVASADQLQAFLTQGQQGVSQNQMVQLLQLQALLQAQQQAAAGQPLPGVQPTQQQMPTHIASVSPPPTAPAPSSTPPPILASTAAPELQEPIEAPAPEPVPSPPPTDIKPVSTSEGARTRSRNRRGQDAE